MRRLILLHLDCTVRAPCVRKCNLWIAGGTEYSVQSTTEDLTLWLNTRIYGWQAGDQHPSHTRFSTTSVQKAAQNRPATTTD